MAENIEKDRVVNKTEHPISKYHGIPADDKERKRHEKAFKDIIDCINSIDKKIKR